MNRLITVEPTPVRPSDAVSWVIPWEAVGSAGQVIVGSLLGDGAMRCKTNALLEINHSFHQQGYVDGKISTFGRPGADSTKGSKEQRRTNRVSVRNPKPPRVDSVLPVVLRDRSKRIPELELSELTLAVWFMDDGCRSRNAVYLNTQQYDEVSQSTVLRLLREQWGIEGAFEPGQDLLPSPVIGRRYQSSQGSSSRICCRRLDTELRK